MQGYHRERPRSRKASHPRSRRDQTREPGKTQQTQRIIPCGLEKSQKNVRFARDVYILLINKKKRKRKITQAARDFGRESVLVAMGIVAPRGYDSSVCVFHILSGDALKKKKTPTTKTVSEVKKTKTKLTSTVFVAARDRGRALLRRYVQNES